MSFATCYFAFWAAAGFFLIAMPILRRLWWLYCRRRLLRVKALCKMTRWERFLWRYFDSCEVRRMQRTIDWKLNEI